MWRKGNPHTLLVQMQIGAATVENSMEFLQKIKNRTTLWPYNSTSGHISKETQNSNPKALGLVHTPKFTAAVFTIAKTRKQHKCPPIDEWIKKLWFPHTQWNITQPQKNEVLPFATARMELEGIVLTEVSQTKTNMIWFHNYVRNLKNNINCIIST